MTSHCSVHLQSEATPPEEAFNPTVKRSGWRPPADTGLWKAAEVLRARVWESIGSEQATFLRAEMAFFDAVTGVSGKLYPVAKENRRAKAAEYLAVRSFAHHRIPIVLERNLCRDAWTNGHASFHWCMQSETSS